MAIFTPRVEQEIINEINSYIVANSPLSDLIPGSVLMTIVEAVSAEVAELYMQAYETLRGYSLDTVTGSELDDRASEYGLTRETAATASGNVVLSDSAITKVSSEVYNNFPGPVIGQTYVYSIKVDTIGDWPATDDIIVGRTTSNVEVVTYSSIDDTNPLYTKFLLSTPFTIDHGREETIILSQAGDRVVAAGTVVIIPSSDTSEEVSFITSAPATILDGESELTGVLVQASVSGSAGNAPVNAISEYDALPFATAEVNNTVTFTNGADEETDQELRDRIKAYVQTLSKGTTSAIELAATGVEYSSQRVVSSQLIETVDVAAPSLLYIDDGTGFEATETGNLTETVVLAATGGELFLGLDNFPLTKEVYVHSLSDEIDFDDGGGVLFCALTNGLYEIEDLLTEIKTQLDAASVPSLGLTFTVTLDQYNKIKIAADGAFELLWNTGTSDRSAALTLGYNNTADLTGATEYSAGFLPRNVILVKNRDSFAGITLTGGNTATAGFAPGDVAVGDYVKLTADGPADWARVASIGPVVLDWNYTGVTGVGVAAEKIRFVETNEYTINPYNGRIELGVALSAGDKITAGDDYLRAYINTNTAGPIDFDLTNDAAVLHTNCIFTQGSASVTSITAFTGVINVGDWVKRFNDVAALAQFGGAQDVTFTQGSATVTKIGAANFNTVVQVGDFIKFTSDNKTYYNRILSLDTPTSLTLVDGYTGTGGTGTLDRSAPWAYVETVAPNTLTLSWVYAGAGGGAANGNYCTPDILYINIGSLTTVQNAEFLPMDFAVVANPTLATPQEVVDRLNKDLTGVTALIHTVQGGNEGVGILADLYGSNGILQPIAGGANVALDFPTTATYGIDGYKYYTQLLQKVQWIIDGNETEEYEQVRAAGTQVEVLEPTVVTPTIEVTITTEEGVSFVTISDSIQTVILNYINSLGVGADIVVSEIITRVQNLDTVYDITMVTPTSNTAIADGSLARAEASDITVSEAA
ncbi:MAG: hypothetical protein DRQ62_04165 [Gammaproteobacteria bacterium]|nr:MAG: hypothetical protein DRQ62_04165 [Gammaproteobacteria bacterium]